MSHIERLKHALLNRFSQDRNARRAGVPVQFFFFKDEKAECSACSLVHSTSGLQLQETQKLARHPGNAGSAHHGTVTIMQTRACCASARD